MSILSQPTKFKLQLISMFLAIFTGIVFIVLILITSTKTDSSSLLTSTTNPTPAPKNYYNDDPSDGFIVPQGRNPESPNNGFSAQITGTVSNIYPEQLIVSVNQTQTKIILPSQIQYYCLPANYTDKYGNQVDLSQIFVDTRELVKTSPFLPRLEIIKNFKPEEQINVKVTYNQQNQAVADFILDYNCEN